MSRQRVLFLLSAASVAVAGSLHASAQAQDAAASIGRREIAAQAYGLEALRLTYAPGERSLFHVHASPRLVVVLRGGQLTSISKEGLETKVELQTGSVAILPPTAHVVRNDDDTTIELIELEVPVAPPCGSLPNESPANRHE
jgi:quercetin dioxygenase-like cupin family protein